MAEVRICSIPGCGKPEKVKSRQLCNLHYRRFQRHGDPTAGMAVQVPSADKIKWLEDHVAHTSQECLIWPFALNGDGYGTLNVGRQRQKAHRLMCEFAHGPTPDASLDCAHSCGNRPCVNPKHLRWATRLENVADAKEHGTLCKGSKNHMTPLSETDVLEICRLKDSGVKNMHIAEQFCIRRSTVTQILNGSNWGWLTGRG